MVQFLNTAREVAGHVVEMQTRAWRPCQDSTVCERRSADLEHQLAARDEFIATLGVELRNSVAPLVLLADHFDRLKVTTDPAIAARVSQLNRQVRKLTVTIDRITELSALREGRIDLSYELVDLQDVLEDVVREQANDALRSGARLHVVRAPPVQGWWDRARVKQIVANLVENAIRYGDGAEVELATELHGTQAELSVSDNGPGIPIEHREFLFDRFEHAPPHGAGGFGVGLCVVKLLSEAMGGTVTLESGTAGARFCVTLPRG